MAEEDSAKTDQPKTQEAARRQTRPTSDADEERKKKKDFWEKFNSMSTFLSTIIVALVGGYFTYSYNSREAKNQQRVQETQTVAQLMPFLTSKDQSQKRTALIAIKVLQDAKLMVDLAASDPKSPGAREALREVLREASNEDDKRVATETLRQFEFILTCPVPFQNPASRPIDDSIEGSCGVFGSPGTSSDVEGAQNFAKNNFCAKRPIQSVTFAQLRDLQAKVRADHSIPFGNVRSHPLTDQPGPAADRKPLQALGEGREVSLRGFVLIARQEGAESVNCGASVPNTPENHDIHISIVESSTQKDECTGIIVEMSPHYRPTLWTAQNVNAIAQKGLPVRVKGQLFFDSSHTPCGNGSPVPGDAKRSSEWEIHPIYEFDVCPTGDCQEGEDWKTLEDYLKPKEQ